MNQNVSDRLAKRHAAHFEIQQKKRNKRNVAADLHHYITETPLISFIEIRFMNKHQVWNRWCKNRYLLVRAYDYTIHNLQPISEHH